MHMCMLNWGALLTVSRRVFAWSRGPSLRHTICPPHPASPPPPLLSQLKKPRWEVSHDPAAWPGGSLNLIQLTCLGPERKKETAFDNSFSTPKDGGGQTRTHDPGVRHMRVVAQREGHTQSPQVAAAGLGALRPGLARAATPPYTLPWKPPPTTQPVLETPWLCACCFCTLSPLSCSVSSKPSQVPLELSTSERLLCGCHAPQTGKGQGRDQVLVVFTPQGDMTGMSGRSGRDQFGKHGR
ncbi:PREDICTED: uncharacterized protein LOC102027096 [Chinchilla lanigera]|uniref:uncharacterized protein LOC102027096 n=1 Tax=Chinchilla lanigera TaxID=34839 RepID=UPI000698868D|nr:PREDICTED: uncharacterized protein LOC102027096 [Chinchilla lanigera]